MSKEKTAARLALLESVSLFSRLDWRQLKAILKVCSEREFGAGELLMEQGTPGIGLFIIAEGRVRISKTLRDGSVVAIGENGVGDVLGEMSVLDGAMRTATVQALVPTVCLGLSAWSFKALMERHPEVALGVLPVVVQRFRATNDSFLDLVQSKPADGGPAGAG